VSRGEAERHLAPAAVKRVGRAGIEKDERLTNPR
jgi:hypothetical protein